MFKWSRVNGNEWCNLRNKGLQACVIICEQTSITYKCLSIIQNWNIMLHRYTNRNVSMNYREWKRIWWKPRACKPLLPGTKHFSGKIKVQEQKFAFMHHDLKVSYYHRLDQGMFPRHTVCPMALSLVPFCMLFIHLAFACSLRNTRHWVHFIQKT